MNNTFIEIDMWIITDALDDYIEKCNIHINNAVSNVERRLWDYRRSQADHTLKTILDAIHEEK